ncbi:FecR family protein [Halalkalibaculum sp. DA3122]|uniref:FecR family protein n=1 Tax=Halalkalibaculum sp. DA3122 TaxID=3373607 RepID=UPI0037542B42
MDNSKLEQLLSDESFVLWLKGEASPGQKERWDVWLQEQPGRRQLVADARVMMQALEREHELPDPHLELQKLNQKIDQAERASSSQAGAAPGLYHRRRIAPVAAGIVFLVVLLGGVFAYQAYPSYQQSIESTAEKTQTTPVKEYETDYGEKLTFRLSDGSRIVLNANSELRFSSRIEEGLNTEVWLKGEAYFDITHLEDEQQRTFTVHTDNGSVQVLGTRFAVNTFRGRTQTVLEEGEVSVRVRDEDTGKPNEYLLEPGEMVQFKAYDNKIAVKQVNTRVYTSWKEDKLIFEKTPMEEVARRIEDTFGVEVVLSSKFSKEKLSGSIKSDNIEVLREALEKILKTEIVQRGNKLLIGDVTQN